MGQQCFNSGEIDGIDKEELIVIQRERESSQSKSKSMVSRLGSWFLVAVACVVSVPALSGSLGLCSSLSLLLNAINFFYYFFSFLSLTFDDIYFFHLLVF